jgi:Gpi18-like mannosyltransferase
MTTAAVNQPIDQRPDALLPIALLVASVMIHLALWPMPAPEYDQFLHPWYRHIADRGLVQAFAEPFSNYTPTYLYLLGLATLAEPWLPAPDGIKLVSVLGSLLLGLAVIRLLTVVRASSPLLEGMWITILPTLLINGVMTSQCDAYWVAPAVMATAASLERRHVAMLVWVGVGVAVKAQMAFLAPFVFAVLLRHRVPLHLWLIPPAVAAAIMTPAWLAGWPAIDLALVYLRQGAQLPQFVSNAANPWIVAAFVAPELGKALVPAGFAASAIIMPWLAWWLRGRLADGRALLHAALLSAMLMPFVLPKMHERYFLLADVLAFILALVARDVRSAATAVLVSLSSLMAILGFLIDSTPMAMGSVIPSSIALLLTWQTVARTASDR